MRWVLQECLHEFKYHFAQTCTHCTQVLQGERNALENDPGQMEGLNAWYDVGVLYQSTGQA